MQGPGAQLAFVTSRVTLLFGSSDDEQERAASTSGEIAIMRRKCTLSPVGAVMLNLRRGVPVTNPADRPLRRLAVAPQPTPLVALSAEPPRSLRLLQTPNARTECRDHGVVGDSEIPHQPTVAVFCCDRRRPLDRANNPDGHGEPTRETRFIGGRPAVVHANAYLTDHGLPVRVDVRERVLLDEQRCWV